MSDHTSGHAEPWLKDPAAFHVLSQADRERLKQFLDERLDEDIADPRRKIFEVARALTESSTSDEGVDLRMLQAGEEIMQQLALWHGEDPGYDTTWRP
ncbi:hypothetical protein [Actinomadura litoris]|uniref:hypothetical protein n=1 Tax=Actinomadura litoris TaxID=2678616 RepID=UPI001FA75768|nr:hypothetical protein [Actinomadura litoris]